MEWASQRGDGVAIPGGVQEALGWGTGGCGLVVQGLQGSAGLTAGLNCLKGLFPCYGSMILIFASM